MDFKELVHRQNKKLNKSAIFVWLACLLALVSLVLAIRLWPHSEHQPILSYLPDSTNFYYHFTDNRSWEKEVLADYPGLDLTVPRSQIEKLQTLLGVSFLNSKEIVWFRINQSQGDNYLLRLIPLQKKVLQQLQTDNPDLYFKQLDRDILLIAESSQLANTSISTENRFVATQKEQGISLYWHLEDSPEFLEPLKPFLTDLFSSQEAKMHIYLKDNGQRVINLYDVDSSLDQQSFPDYEVPSDFDLAMAFSQHTPANLASSLTDDVIRQLLPDLPYTILSPQAIADDILHQAVIFQRADSWLLVFFSEADPVILNFLDNFQVAELSKTLPDGTLYKELVVNPSQDRQEIAYHDKIYYQVADLYLYQTVGVNYLSTSQEIIKQIITAGQSTAFIWANCLDPQVKVGDFIYLNSENIADSQIQDYLNSHHIDQLGIFSYLLGSTEGLQICF